MPAKHVFLNCPSDRTDLIQFRREGVSVWQCPQCRGLWLPVRSLPAKNSPGMELKVPPSAETFQCPACQKPMYSRTYRGYSLMLCEACRHVWIREETMASLASQSRSRSGLDEELVNLVLQIVSLDPDFLGAQAIAGGIRDLGEISAHCGEAVVEFFVDLVSGTL